ncbi:TPA: UDP-N-acetylmuramoyl-tripeptide--D-alanyl-D-alanine ligase [Candidatus Poribacteria bacterium]|nr:UDP-N-acetylmuramoyl-tripeptide--D-alanyl-D-alanine ligase [Candidatus Poribacteria bacterium]
MNFITHYTWILLIPAVLVWVTRAVIRTSGALHILQLEGYKSARFLRWLVHNPKRMLDIKELIALVDLLILALIAYFFNVKTLTLPVFILLWIAIELYFIITHKPIKAKRPLVYTARASRLFRFAIFLIIGSVVIVISQSGGLSIWRLNGDQLYFQFMVLFAFTSVLNQLSAINLTLANVLLYPVERSINAGYFRQAQERIKKLKPKVIGITGSYGKTSTKYILQKILSQRFNSLMTPDSYNTPMGICKVINGQLKPEHEIFIVEMGAYKRGEIKELCELTQPEIGVLTAVGAQHLERFKSIDNIANTKYELIESLPPNGIAVFNNDNEICRRLADKTTIKTVRYGINTSDDTVKLTAKDIKNTSRGLIFNVEDSSGASAEFRTKLLGGNNVYNILAATAVALECGMTLSEVSRAVGMLAPIPHRLQLIPSGNGVTVIDDGFNANPVGAKAALEVLDSFETGRKILITPGMVELGELEFKENKIFGEQAAKVCDFVILVGPNRTKPILEGLREAGFPEENIIIAKSLAEASERMREMVKAGDVVLFENDLPDTYNE